MRINKSILDDAGLYLLEALGCEILPSLVITPGEPAPERADSKQVWLFDWMQIQLLPNGLCLPIASYQLADKIA